MSPYSLFTYKPTHTIVLGDLFSSQWIIDEEFNKRVERYKWIFGDPRGVSGSVSISLLKERVLISSNEISYNNVGIQP